MGIWGPIERDKGNYVEHSLQIEHVVHILSKEVIDLRRLPNLFTNYHSLSLHNLKKLISENIGVYSNKKDLFEIALDKISQIESHIKEIKEDDINIIDFAEKLKKHSIIPLSDDREFPLDKFFEILSYVDVVDLKAIDQINKTSYEEHKIEKISHRTMLSKGFYSKYQFTREEFCKAAEKAEKSAKTFLFFTSSEVDQVEYRKYLRMNLESAVPKEDN